MAKIQEVVNAQIYLPQGLSDKRELQLEVYKEGCNGETTIETISHEELLNYLNNAIRTFE